MTKPRAEIAKQSEELLSLLQTPAADAYSATCPNPSVLQRCENAGVIDRFNRVVQQEVVEAAKE